MRTALALTLCLLACRTTAPVAEPPVAAPPVAEAPPAPPPPAFRAPADLLPTRYALELTLVPEAKSFRGLMRLEARVTAPTAVVWLHAVGLDIARATVAGRPATVLPGANDFIGLRPEAPLGVGPTTVEVEYTAPIDHQRSRGVYAEQEGAQTYAYTFFEPIDARRAFPCIDEPAAKVPWQLTFHVKREHLALGNAPVLRETDEPDGWKRVELAETPPLPSYLVAFMVGPFEVVDGGSAAGVPIRFVLPQGRASELAWSKEVTPKVLTALLDWAALPYPYGKLDVAVVPRFWGTMEHPGLVAMGQPLTLLKPEQATRPARERYANILAHELAHYWFGDLVTMRWWNDTWLNEALGSYLDPILTDAVMPAWQVRDGRVGSSVQAMDADELPGTRALSREVVTSEDIEASFDNAITYAKGSSVLRMFEAWAGEEPWRAFLRRYLADHRHGNASAEDFVAGLRRDLGAPVADAFSTFLTQPGVPLVTARLRCGAKPVLTLTQRRSLSPGVKRPAPEPTWQVPVCVRHGDTKRSARTCVLLTGATQEVTLEQPGCPTWVVPNAGAAGYYRSAVDLPQARALLTTTSAEAKAARTTVAERLMLLADLKATAARGDLPRDQALGLASLAAADPSDRVAAMGIGLGSLRTDVLSAEDEARARDFQLRTFGPLARKLGWKRGPDDSDDRQALRRRALGVAVGARDPALTAEGVRLARAWLEAPASAGLDDDLVGLALSAAARTGDAALYDTLLSRAREAKARTTRQRLLTPLGAFLDPALAARTRELVAGTEFDLRETSWLVARQLAQRETREAAWTWLQANLDGMLGRMRDDEASWLMGAVAGQFCDEAHRQAAQALLTPRAARHDGAQLAVGRGLEESAACIAEVTRDGASIKRFLARQPGK